MTLQQRWQLSIECTLVLFACSAGLGTLQVWLNNAEAAGAYWMVIGVPATAAVAFLVISMCFPALFAVRALRFPLQLTLPVVFNSLLVLGAAMWLTTPEELISNFDVVRFARLWQQPGELFLVTGTEIVGMVLLGILRRF